jgi:uroporphyrinogen-III synthase
MAKANGVELIEVPALKMHTIISADELRLRLESVSRYVITSMSAIKALFQLDCLDMLKGAEVLVVGKHTASRVEGHGGRVSAVVGSASELVDKYGKLLNVHVLHLSGKHVAVELPVQRLAIYTITQTMPVIDEVDATAIFSPRGAQSVLTERNAGRLGEILSIGPTTTRAIEQLGYVVHHTSPVPDEVELLRSCLEGST